MIRGALGWKCRTGSLISLHHPSIGCVPAVVRAMDSSSSLKNQHQRHPQQRAQHDPHVQRPQQQYRPHNYRTNGASSTPVGRARTDEEHDNGKGNSSHVAAAPTNTAVAGLRTTSTGSATSASHISSAGPKPKQGSFGGAGAASQKSQLPNSSNSASGQPSIVFGTGDFTVDAPPPVSSNSHAQFPKLSNNPVSSSSNTQFPKLSNNLKQVQTSTVQPVTEGRDKEQVGNDDPNKDLPLPGSLPGSVESEAPPPLVEAKGTNVSHSQVSQKRPSERDLPFSWGGQSKGSVPVSEPPLPRDDSPSLGDDFPPLGATSTGAKKKFVGSGGVGGSAEQAQNAHARLPSKPQEPRQRSEGESGASARGGESNINQNRYRGNFDGRRGGGRQGGEWRTGRHGGDRRDGRQDGQRRDATYEKQNSIEALGRTLSRILRHQAVDLDLKVRTDGFVAVKDLLQLSMKTRSNRALSSYTVEDIMQAVNQDTKHRFGTKEENGQLLIRASQGHTMKAVEAEQLLKRIVSADEVPVCVHGTYRKYLDAIYKEGLKRMTRNHVHFATGEYGTENVISGMRKTCDVLIHLDVEKALADGMKLYISENGVILTEGFDGVVPPAYFAGVLSVPGMRPIPPP